VIHSPHLLRKLQQLQALTDDDVDAIRRLPVRIVNYGPRSTIVAERDQPGQCGIVMSGFACRAKTAANGRRHIVSFHVPGDLPDLQSLFLKIMDHELFALSACTMGFVPHEDLGALVHERPRILDAFWRETLVDASIYREWIVNSHRPAAEALAHLVCEVSRRLQAVGIATEPALPFPVTQVDLADALGLTTVHINRVLKILREDNILQMRRQEIVILDAARLAAFAGFDDLYLHQLR
jgi:CRP-like cAMP-binding protein